MKNGADKDTPVNFSMIITENQLSEKIIDCVNDLNFRALLRTKEKLKNTYTYIPKKISWVYNDSGKLSGKWSIKVEYSVQNDFGALKDGFEMYFLNNDGTEYKPF